MAIGSVSVHVTPDATDFWRRFREQTRADTPDVDIRVRADTAAARAEIERLRGLVAGMHGVNVNVAAGGAGGAAGQVNLLRDAIATLGSAAVPIAGVLGGALVGLVPVVTTLALGLAGIKDEMKSGALAGTAYGADISTLKTEFGALKAQAAGGILTGLHAALAGSKPLFREINADTAIMSRQLGGIVAGAAPALARIFTQLNPLFTTFGEMLVRGAGSLNRWAQNSTGVASFVAYVQAELPKVVHLVSDLAVFLGHVVQAAAPFGGVVLGGVGAVVRVLSELPVGVLQVLVPLLAATRVGFLAWRGITGAVDGVTAAVGRLSGATGRAQIASQVAAAQLRLTAAQNEATIAAEASAIALARASEAETAADAALANAAAARSISVTAAAEAEAVAAAKVAEAESYAAAAEAAVLAAATTAAAAETAAADVVAAGTVARAGWTAMLGPIGALVIGLGILATSFLGSSKDTKTAADANAAYAESVKQSTNALAAANLKATADQLSKSGALDLTSQLTTANKGLIVSFGGLAQAVNGPQAGFDALIGKLKSYAEAHSSVIVDTGSGEATKVYDAQGQAALDLIPKLTTLRGTLSANIQEQELLNEAMRQNQQLADGGSAAAHRQASALGLTGTAYLNAQLAAQKNTAATAAQSAAMQVAGDAAGLLKQALDGLAGVDLSVAQAQTSFLTANNAVAASFKANGKAIDGASAKALANQSAVQQQITSARDLAAAIGKKTHSTAAEIQSLKDSKKAMEDQLRSQHQLTPAVQAYIDKLYAINEIHLKPTPVDVAAKAALDKIAGFQHTIDNIKQHQLPGLGVDSKTGKLTVANLQLDIDAVRHHRPIPLYVNSLPAALKAHALQVRIDRIRQGKAPGIDANTKAGRAKIAALQHQIDVLTGKTIGINVDYHQYTTGSKPSGVTATGSQALSVPNAAGTGPGGLKPGWGTVGERGWEAVYTAGGKTQVFSHEMSQQILGVNQAPGYSAGTTPPPDNRPASHANSPAANISITQNIVNPLPETASVSGPAGLRRAALALGRP